MHDQSRRKRRTITPILCEPVPESVEYELWHRNADASPLLRLPPEIRNRIYALVLGVGQIHIRYRPWRHRTCVRGGKQVTDTTPGGFYVVFLGADQDPWAAAAKMAGTIAKPDHSNAVFAGSSASSAPAHLTALAAACRQLYRDAALLPFSLNVWSFENARIMERYLLRARRLTRTQRRAVGVLLVGAADDLPSRDMEQLLGGLRAVVWRDESRKGKGGAAELQRWELAGARELRRLVEESRSNPSQMARVGHSNSDRGIYVYADT